MPSANILVVDDEPSICHFAGRSLADAGHDVRTVGTGQEALEAFGDRTPDLVVLDVMLPDANGLDLLQKFKEQAPDTAVIMVTAVDRSETAVQAMSRGAFWYLKKPLELGDLNTLVERALDGHRAQRLQRELEHHRQHFLQKEGYVRCQAPSMQEIYRLLDQIATSETTSVLIEGESGTGKEIIARYLHIGAAQESKPFIEINCAAIPKDLLESELFGHEKGAFTDARAQKQGLLELAHGGTLFLDEIGEMSLQLQVKLLRVIERRTFKRVGGVKDITVSTRIVSATNQDLGRLVQAGHFREDLYYRLRVVPIHVPPLRERREDILPLAQHFRERFNGAFKKQFVGFTPEAEQLLVDYAWPGNVRELRNLMERTVLLEQGDILERTHFHLNSSAPPARQSTLGTVIDDILYTGDFPEDGVPFEEIVENLEKALILKAWQASHGNQSRTAELLQLKRDKLRYRMKHYGLKEGESSANHAVPD